MVKWWIHKSCHSYERSTAWQVWSAASVIVFNWWEHRCFRCFWKQDATYSPWHIFPSLKPIVSERYFPYRGRRDDVFPPWGEKILLVHVIALNLRSCSSWQNPNAVLWNLKGQQSVVVLWWKGHLKSLFFPWKKKKKHVTATRFSSILEAIFYT